MLAAQPLSELTFEQLFADAAAGDSANNRSVHKIEPLAVGSGNSSAAASLAQNAYGLTGLGQTVAVLDSGIAYNHSALGGGFGPEYRVVGGWDFGEDDADPDDPGLARAHGTHVAGVIGSSDPDHPGIAPDVDLVALRVYNDMGAGYFRWVEDALDWVHEHRNDFRYPITTVNLSLGAAWNDEVVPDWQTLEDEFAQLEEDGIFIAVAAGNSFLRYNEPGLGYPAVSPHVVPVSSVDADGSLSYFSQRHERAIAAPGRDVVSAVPDGLGDRNGIDDDFASYSGTSEASPYVAGASVLIRQAFELVGRSGVTQDDIYDVMMSTADLTWDATTEQYYARLNLDAALESILPDGKPDVAVGDDSGIDDNSNAGDNSSADDNSSAGDNSNADSGADENAADENAADENAADENIPPPPALPPGPVQVYGTIATVTGTDAADKIRVSAGHHRILIDINGERFAFGRDEVTEVRIDAGGDDDEVLLTAADNGLAAELGPAGASLRGDGFSATISGAENVRVVSKGSSSTVHFLDSPGDDRFTASPKSAILRGGGFTSRAVGFSQVFADASSGGFDRARLDDSDGDDLLSGYSTHTVLQGAGFYLQVTGFDQVQANSRSGSDQARLYDSPEDDRFIIRRTASYLRGDAFVNFVRGFSRVDAYATSGGDDTAYFMDITTNDRLEGVGDRFAATRGSQQRSATGFELVIARPTSGAAPSAEIDAVDYVFKKLGDWA